MNWFYVFLGGGIGSVTRYGLSLLLKSSALVFPWPTLAANVLASILIAMLYFAGVKTQSSQVWLFLATGFCGGLSTFSAFSLETFQLIKQGNQWMAFLNIMLSVVMCVAVIYLLSKLMGSISE